MTRCGGFCGGVIWFLTVRFGVCEPEDDEPELAMTAEEMIGSEEAAEEWAAAQPDVPHPSEVDGDDDDCC